MGSAQWLSGSDKGHGVITSVMRFRQEVPLIHLKKCVFYIIY